MSKRYTFTRPYKDAYEIVDRKIDKALNPEDVADLLNQQDQRIAELEEQHREMRNAYRRKKYREKCRRDIENEIIWNKG